MAGIDYNNDSEFFKALGHPVRLKIVHGIINNKGCNVSQMVEKLKLPQSTVSQHLGILRSRGIIVPCKNGVSTCYEISDSRVQAIVKIIESR